MGDSILTIIPDVHGRAFWRDAIPNLGRGPLVFLGDYLDHNTSILTSPRL